MRAFVAAMVVCIAFGASAQVENNKQLAKQHYNEGTRLYDLNDYGKALESFRKAYLAYEEPTLLFNIAQCQRQLGQKDDAIKTYRSFLRKVPNASNRAEVERLVAKLEEALEKERQANRMPPQGVNIEPPKPEPAKVEPAPTPVEPAAAPPAATPTEHAAAPTPVYKKWWLWTIVGVVIVGGAVGAGVGIALSGSSFHRTLPDTGPGAGMAIHSLEVRF